MTAAVELYFLQPRLAKQELFPASRREGVPPKRSPENGRLHGEELVGRAG